MNEPVGKNQKNMKKKILKFLSNLSAFCSFGSGVSSVVLAILQVVGVTTSIFMPLIILFPILCGFFYIVYLLIPTDIYEKVSNLLNQDKLTDVELEEIKKIIDNKTQCGTNMDERTVYNQPQNFQITIPSHESPK
jgi:Zn-dependent membrane protease YugP